MMQEAYGILNDPEKRREFDLSESEPFGGLFRVGMILFSKLFLPFWCSNGCLSPVSTSIYQLHSLKRRSIMLLIYLTIAIKNSTAYA